MQHGFVRDIRRRRLFLCFLTLVLTGSGLCAVSFAAGLTLTGTVLGPDESPVAGLLVEAGPIRDETDGKGSFRLTGLEPGDTLLRLHGDAGEGRVKVTVRDDEASLSLTYPVITTVVLLHDNDHHFNFNQREAFEAAVNAIRVRYENVFLMNAGDIFVRHPDRWPVPNNFGYYQERCAFMINTMNDLGYAACTPGNHELFYLEAYTRTALELAEFPLLGANIEIETDRLPPLKPYTRFETGNGLSIAVLGLSRSNEQAGIKVLDYIETARAHEFLASEHDLFVALTHLGLAQDRELAKAVPEIDLIIGGHSHHLPEEGEELNGVLLAMAGGPPARHQVDPDWPKYLGKITIIFENDRIIRKTARFMIFEATEATLTE